MKQSVDLLLINPGNRLEQFAKLNDLATVAQPLGVAMVAAYARQLGFSVAIIDAEAEFWTPDQTIGAIEQYDPVLLGISAFTTKMTAAERTLRLVKERMPHVPTMIGGHHASSIPEQTLENETIDFAIVGEGYVPTVRLLQALKEKRTDFDIQGVWYARNGQVVPGGRAVGVRDLDALPFPAWDLLPMDKYRAHHWQRWGRDNDANGFALVYTSLGCPFSCDYCSVNVVYEKHMTRYRSPEKVAEELRILVEQYNVRHVEIIDDTFTLNTKRVAAICNAIIERNLGDKLNMWCFARTDRTDPGLMKKMKQAGVNWVFMGFESGSDTVLQGVNKCQTVEQIKRATDIVHNAGISIGGNYVFGLPEDTDSSMLQTLDLAKELNTEYANFFVMMAYPGTAYYDMAKDKGYPLPEKWGQYGFFAPDSLPLRNDRLSAEDILKFRDTAFKEYFHGTRYQAMIKEKFGQDTLDFIRTRILSKDIYRTRYRL